MFEILQSFLNRIVAADAAYDEDIKNIEAAEKTALNKIKAEEAKLEADHARKMAVIKADHERKIAAIKASQPNHSLEVEEALRKHRDLCAKFEALMAKHAAR